MNTTDYPTVPPEGTLCTGIERAIPLSTQFRSIRALCRTMGKAQWRLDNGVELRTRIAVTRDGELEHQTHCPLSFAASIATGQHYRPSEFVTAGYRIGFVLGLPTVVACAADNRVPAAYQGSPSRYSRMRSILIRAAGLPPEHPRP